MARQATHCGNFLAPHELYFEWHSSVTWKRRKWKKCRTTRHLFLRILHRPICRLHWLFGQIGCIKWRFCGCSCLLSLFFALVYTCNEEFVNVSQQFYLNSLHGDVIFILHRTPTFWTTRKKQQQYFSRICYSFNEIALTTWNFNHFISAFQAAWTIFGARFGMKQFFLCLRWKSCFYLLSR